MADYTAKSTPPRRPPQGNRLASRNDVAVPDGYLAVGKIVGVHGLKGELKVELYTDYPERFEEGVVFWMGRGGKDELEAVTVRTARSHKNLVLLNLVEVADRNQAEEIRGLWLFVDEEEAVELEEGVYFIHDILGLQVVTDEGEALGSIDDVLFTGANEVYVVHGKALPDGELLLPAIDEVIRAIDLERGQMTVHLMEGMLERVSADEESPSESSRANSGESPSPDNAFSATAATDLPSSENLS